MEGNTYQATWIKKGKSYIVSLVNDASLTASDLDFNVACDELCLLLCDKYGDGEAVLDMKRDPPVPKNVKPYIDPPLIVLSWNESAYGETWQDGLYENGYCSMCKAGVGKRTTKPLEVKELPKGNTGSYNHMMCNFLLISKELKSLFSDKEIQRLGLQKIKYLGKNNKVFYEVLGEPTLKEVGVIGGKYNQLISFECKNCNQKQFSCSHPELPDTYEYIEFVVKEDLPIDIKSAFIIEDGNRRKMICMATKRWLNFKSKDEAKGVLKSRIYVIPETQAVRNPKVKITDDF